MVVIKPCTMEKQRCYICTRLIRPQFWLSLQLTKSPLPYQDKNCFIFFCSTRCMRKSV